MHGSGGRSSPAISVLKRRASLLNRRGRLLVTGCYRVARGARAPMPRFLVPGVGKSGTSTLNRLVLQHPRIVAPYTKQLDFFTNYYFMGPRWYRAMLDRDQTPMEVPPITFDATHFITRPEAASWVARLLPETKLIVLLRNPANLAISRYHSRARQSGAGPAMERQFIDDISFLEPLLELRFQEIVEHAQQHSRRSMTCLSSLYAHILAHWLQHIPRERFLIIRSEDFFADQKRTADRIFRFVGAPPFETTGTIHENRGGYAEPDRALYRRLDAFFKKANRNLVELAGAEFHWD
jgi:hypothetical protein